MTYTWKVTWNKNLYDYENITLDYKNNKIEFIKQSKGLAKMTNVPKIDDIVYVSCNKLKIMKCIVESNFKQNNEYHESDKYNLGDTRVHSKNEIYLFMKIIKVYDDRESFNGNQRTWCKIKENVTINNNSQLK